MFVSDGLISLLARVFWFYVGVRCVLGVFVVVMYGVCCMYCYFVLFLCCVFVTVCLLADYAYGVYGLGIVFCMFLCLDSVVGVGCFAYDWIVRFGF